MEYHLPLEILNSICISFQHLRVAEGSEVFTVDDHWGDLFWLSLSLFVF